MLAYHVTSKSNAEDILKDGFLGGYGDAGFGVYFYSDYMNAQDYLDAGGWDGSIDPNEAVIIEIEIDDNALEAIIPEPDWPNPEDYDDVSYYPMDQDNDEETFKPATMRILACGPKNAPIIKP